MADDQPLSDAPAPALGPDTPIGGQAAVEGVMMRGPRQVMGARPPARPSMT